jgi:hypothetical protein
MLDNLGKAKDKYEAAMAMQPEAIRHACIPADAAMGSNSLPTESIGLATPLEREMEPDDFPEKDANGQPSNGKTGNWEQMNRHFSYPANFDAAKAFIGRQIGESKGFLGRKVFLTVKTIRRILACKETLHKYGVFVPRNDRGGRRFARGNKMVVRASVGMAPITRTRHL